MSGTYATKIIGVKEASELTGLSQWELRQGAKQGKYPCLRVGCKNGKILFNLDLLTRRIDLIMEQNIAN